MLAPWLVAGLLVATSPAIADDWSQYNRTRQAVRSFNFDVTYVQVKPNQITTYRWLHGVHQPGGALAVPLELERLSLQDGIGTDMFRRGDRVYYAAPDAPVIATKNSDIPELPAILFMDGERLANLYDVVAGSQVPLSGRTAQLLRLSAKDNNRYSYWLWQDAETGFPLRIDTVSSNNDVLDRWMVVHMQIKPGLPTELQSLLSAQLPDEIQQIELTKQPASNFKLSWLPDGYQVLDNQLNISTRAMPLLAHWLLSDGLHQISVFVQPSAGLPTQLNRDGANTILVSSRENLDVVVIGPIAPELAQQLAAAVE